jgi:hypothetical protein
MSESREQDPSQKHHPGAGRGDECDESGRPTPPARGAVNANVAQGAPHKGRGRDTEGGTGGGGTPPSRGE